MTFLVLLKLVTLSLSTGRDVLHSFKLLISRYLNEVAAATHVIGSVDANC